MFKDGYFPTQNPVSQDKIVMTIGEKDVSYGAPYGPLPKTFLSVPDTLNICTPLADLKELEIAYKSRKPFIIEGCEQPFMDDIIRAFRLVLGKKVYIEVGTFDRGNLAYVSGLLAEDATIIGIDIQAEQNLDVKLKKVLKPHQKYISIVGDSRAPETINAVKSGLNGCQADVVFIDGNHTAPAVLCDYVNFSEMVKTNGFIMFHDSLWEGDADYKGTAYALEQIDKLDPIYLVPSKGAVYRFMRTMWRDSLWGVVGVHIKK